MSALAASAGREATARFDETEPDDLPKLIALALVLDTPRRRARFGAALSDDAIRRHYMSLDGSRYVATGAFVQRRLEAAVELYALGDDWSRAEICAIGLPGALRRWAARLTREAIGRAERRGCQELLWFAVGPPDGWSSALAAAQRDAGIPIKALHAN